MSLYCRVFASQCEEVMVKCRKLTADKALRVAEMARHWSKKVVNKKVGGGRGIRNQQHVRLYSYLNLKDRLSQIWINYYTLILILMAIKIIFFKRSLIGSLDHAQQYTVSSCKLLDEYASKVASIPHYSAQAANTMISKGIEETNAALVKGLQLILTGVEQMIIFYIQLMVGTYACLLTAAIDTSVDAATNATETVIDWVNNTLADVTDTVEDGLTDLSKIINKAEAAGDSIIDLFSGKKDDNDTAFNRVNLTISSLKNLRIPSSIDEKLRTLSQKTPDFDTVENKTKSLINVPFQYVRDQLQNQTLHKASGNLMKTPQIKSATICPSDDKILDIYGSAAESINSAAKVLVALILVGSVLIMVPLSIIEYRKWRRAKEMTEEISNLENKSTPANIYEIIDKNNNRVLYFISSSLNKLFNGSGTKLTWITNYSLSLLSLTLLGMAVAGVLLVIFQFIILHIAIKCFQKASLEVKSGSADLRAAMSKAVDDWTISTNDYLNTTQASVNSRLFGIINKTTYSVNHTISAFYDGINEDLDKAFANTVFEKPVKSVVKCVIGNKIESIEKALTWVHDNAVLTLPRVHTSYLPLPSNDQLSVSKMVETSKSLIQDTTIAVIKEYKKSLILELVISLCLLAAFLIQVLVAWFMYFLKEHNINNRDGFLKATNPAPFKPAGKASDYSLSGTTLGNKEKQQDDAYPIVFEDRSYFTIPKFYPNLTEPSSTFKAFNTADDTFVEVDIQSPPTYNQNSKPANDKEVQIILSPPKKYRKVGLYNNPFEDEIL